MGSTAKAASAQTILSKCTWVYKMRRLGRGMQLVLITLLPGCIGCCVVIMPMLTSDDNECRRCTVMMCCVISSSSARVHAEQVK